MTPEPHEPAEGAPDAAAERRRFRRTLAGVLIVQGLALLLLWVLQSRYGTG